MFFSTRNDLWRKFSLLKVYKAPIRVFNYGIRGGGFDLRTWTLDQLYEKHVLGWNIWTRSNDGYDLGRYFGTRFTFYPHPHIPYIVFWENNFRTSEFEQLPYMHPFYLLVHRRHTLIIMPRNLGGKKKHHLFIKPPALQTSHWFYQASWSGVSLFRIGWVPFTIENTYVHETSSANYYPKYAVFIGYGQETNNIPPIPLPSYSIANSLDTCTVQIMYRWWWDDGKDNYLLINRNNDNVSTNTKLEAIPIDTPYYMHFFSGLWPTGRAQNYTNDTPQTNATIVDDQNPSPVAILWYRDKAVYKTSDPSKTPTMDERYLRPQDLPDKKKVWVVLSPKTFNINGADNNTNFGTDQAVQSGFTVSTVRAVLEGIVQNSPFVMGEYDIPFMRRQESFTCRYRSIWQWGGTVPRTDTVLNPGEQDHQRPPVSVRNPATVGFSTIHPWDLTQHGGFTEDKFRQILTSLLTPPGPPQLPCTSRPESPPSRPRHPPKRRRPRSPRPRPPRKRRELDESSEQSSSESSGSQTTLHQSSSEAETTTESEEEDPPPPRIQPRQRFSLLKR